MSPITPPTTMPSPLEFQTCPVSPSAAARLSRFPSQGGAGVSPASAAKVSATPECPLLEPTAWATAEAWAPKPAGSADSAAVVNGVSVDAEDDAPAYPYIAAASWAHISAYCASVAAIAAVFWPRKFVATNATSNARLAAISGGGTVAMNAAS